MCVKLEVLLTKNHCVAWKSAWSCSCVLALPQTPFLNKFTPIALWARRDTSYDLYKTIQGLHPEYVKEYILLPSPSQGVKKIASFFRDNFFIIAYYYLFVNSMVAGEARCYNLAMGQRNNAWLEARLRHIISTYFPDLEIRNTIYIHFGRRGERQLGKISKKHHSSLVSRLKGRFDTIITMNGLFRDPEIPEFVVDGTIIHEMCHYAHGFSSPLPKQSRFPHQGGIIKHEMIKRGAGDIYLAEKKWLKLNWREYLKNNVK